MGRVEVQQVVEGEGVYKCVCGWDYCCVLDGCLLSLSLWSSGFHDLLRLKPPSLFMLFGCISISMASLMRRSMLLVFVERSLVSCNQMMWSWLKLCSATADLSGWANLICLSCSFIPRWTDRPLCPMYTLPHFLLSWVFLQQN